MSNVIAGTGITLDWDDVAKTLTINATDGGGAVDSVNGQTGVVVLDSDDVAEGTTNKYATTANVDAAGAVMVADTSTAGYGFVIDEDGMSSDSATKVPTQQSVKAYVDAQFAGAGYSDEQARDAIGAALVGASGVGVTVDDPGNQITLALSTAARTFTVNFIIDGGGSAITTGTKGNIIIDRACTIQSVTLLADQTGSIVVDIWKDTYANHPPTVADSITASAKPTISSGTKQQDTSLTGWTTAISAGDILRFNVDSIATITRCTVSLKMLATA